MNSNGKVLLGFLALAGVVGLIIYATTRQKQPVATNRSTWRPVGGDMDNTLYENEKRIQLVRGEDGHVQELIIHHTIKRNALDHIPEGVLEI